MTDETKSVEDELREELLNHMDRIRAHLQKDHWVIIGALVDVGEETNLDPLSPEKWTLSAWPYFIDAMTRRLERQQCPQAEDVKSTLRDMRYRIDTLRLLGVISMNCFWKP